MPRGRQPALGRATANLDHRNAPIGSEVPTERVEVANPIVDVVVDVADEGELDLGDREPRIGGFGEHDLDVQIATRFDFSPEPIRDSLVDVHRIYTPSAPTASASRNVK